MTRHGNLEGGRAFSMQHWATRFTTIQYRLSGILQLERESANAFFLDANGVDRTIFLPPVANGYYYYLANVGVSGNLLVVTDLGVPVVTVIPGGMELILSSDFAWKRFPGAISPSDGAWTFGSSRTLTALNESILVGDTAVKINRVGDMTITLPSAAARTGVPLRYADISTPAPDHTVTFVPVGTDTILSGAGGGTSFSVYHNGSDAPRGLITPWDGGIWVFS